MKLIAPDAAQLPVASTASDMSLAAVRDRTGTLTLHRSGPLNVLRCHGPGCHSTPGPLCALILLLTCDYLNEIAPLAAQLPVASTAPATDAEKEASTNTRPYQ